jgi:hypothetical protein
MNNQESWSGMMCETVVRVVLPMKTPPIPSSADTPSDLPFLGQCHDDAWSVNMSNGVSLNEHSHLYCLIQLFAGHESKIYPFNF